MFWLFKVLKSCHAEKLFLIFNIGLLRKLIFRCQLSAAKGLKIKILRFAQNDKRQFPKKSIVEGLAKYMIGTMRLIRKKTLIRAIVVAAFVLLLAACGLAVWLKAWPRQNNTVADRAYS
ncbi:MAG: hypothetical protein FWC55_00575, partial [Firmicutes bacterium]|nr:hypothetical protein [Bacillota bacterium]